VQSLAAWLQEQPFEVPFHTARLETLHPPAAAYAQVASGLLAVRLDPVAPRFALWFRPEVARTVTWAGDPRKPVVRGPGAERLHPRASFDAWKQEVRGTSLPWTQVDLEMARRFREGLVGVVLRQAAALARSNVELDSFSGTVAHDLREPLRGIQQYVSFTLEDYGEGLPPEGRDYLKQAERLAQRTQGLLESLFEYSRLGFVDLSWKEADLQQVLEDELLTVSARLKQNRVEVRIPRPLPRLECDALRLGHVWANLLANAAKYHQPDEPRWVEVGYYAPDEPLPAQARPRAEGYIFYVRDNGIGIAPQFQETIFAMFRRLHAPQAYGGGSGAGLAIARRLVQLHGGSLWVESTPGQGSTFYFTVGRRP
jgi:light-regulated signal transduction histidine kinase (bacteriophytochrome)